MDESIYSTSGNYNLTLQRDGNLVLYNNKTGKSLWASNTAGTANPTQFTVQADCNVCLYGIKDGNEAPYWSTNTWQQATGDIKLIMQDDGNLVLYGDNRAVWKTDTVQK